jgi:hypothetical protein
MRTRRMTSKRNKGMWTIQEKMQYSEKEMRRMSETRRRKGRRVLEGTRKIMTRRRMGRGNDEVSNASMLSI